MLRCYDPLCSSLTPSDSRGLWADDPVLDWGGACCRESCRKSGPGRRSSSCFSLRHAKHTITLTSCAQKKAKYVPLVLLWIQVNISEILKHFFSYFISYIELAVSTTKGNSLFYNINRTSADWHVVSRKECCHSWWFIDRFECKVWALELNFLCRYSRIRKRLHPVSASEFLLLSVRKVSASNPGNDLMSWMKVSFEFIRFSIQMPMKYLKLNIKHTSIFFICA